MPSLLLLPLLLPCFLLFLPGMAFLAPVPATPICHPYSFSSLLATKESASITLPPATHPSTQPTLIRFKRHALRRALHLAGRRLLPFLFSGWVDEWLERRWVEGEKAWERELLVLANDWQEKDNERIQGKGIGKVTEWVVEGPQPLPATVKNDNVPSSFPPASCSSPFVLFRAPLNKRERMKKALTRLSAILRSIFLPPILFGARNSRNGGRGAMEDEEIQEWRLYAAARAEREVNRKMRRRIQKKGEGDGEGVVLGKIGIKFRIPETRTITAVDRAGAALFKWEEAEEEVVEEEVEELVIDEMKGSEGGVLKMRTVGVKVGGGECAGGGLRPLPVVVLVWCYVPPEARGRGYGEKMMEMVSEALLGEKEEKEEHGLGNWRTRKRGRERRGYILLTVDDNGSGRLTGYYQRLGFRMAPSLSSEACEVMLRPIIM